MLQNLINGQPLIIAILIIAVASLSAVIVFLYKAYNRVQTEKDSIQALRVADAQEFKDKLLIPLEGLIELSRKNYDVLQFINNGRSKE